MATLLIIFAKVIFIYIQLYQLAEFLQQTAVVSFGMLHHYPPVVMCLLYNDIASAIT